jgi:serine protease SohB
LEYLYGYGLFLAQAITIVIAIVFVVGSIAAMGQKQSGDDPGHIEMLKLNDQYEEQCESIKAVILSEDEQKAEKKQLKKKKKLDKKQSKNQPEEIKRRVYVLDFDGDIKASATENLRNSISAILTVASEQDEVLLRLESGGGMVHSYGLAASQLQRITDKGIPLTIAVDKVAASGGYMMACVANRIIAAPFAVIGSIGVLAQIPNFHRLLKDNKVDFELLTAGEHKRTLTMFGENTDEQREKFMEELEDTHMLFKSFVSEHRPEVEIATVATGEVWYGLQALNKKLVDELKTSDSYIMEAVQQSDVFQLEFVHKKSWQEKLGVAAEASIERSFLKLWQQATNKLKA